MSSDDERKPRKRARPCSTLEQSTASTDLPTTDRSVNPSLLSLPDEAIFRIMHHLKASDTRGALDKPRHAFALALTNTRLLNIFRSLLTRVTPDTNKACHAVLHLPHFISVICLAGHLLRELHVPSFACQVIAHLPKRCSRLETLHVQEQDSNVRPYGMGYSSSVLSRHGRELFRKLRSLTIIKPHPRTLTLLSPPPEELALKDVSSSAAIRRFLPILRDPPRKLSLYLDFEEELEIEDLDIILPALHRACPRMEDVTVVSQWESECEATGMFERTRGDRAMFLSDALRILDTPRHNEHSRCMRMAIDVAFKDLLRHAHPNAVLEVTRNSETFVKDGKEVYAKRLPLFTEYLTQDLSRLEEVYASGGLNCSHEWQDRLSGMQLHQARLDGTGIVAEFCQSVDILEIEAMFMGQRLDWTLLSRVKELRILGTRFEKFHPVDHEDILISLGDILYRFHGEVVSIRNFETLKIDDAEDRRLGLMMRLINAMRAFEARGGHATSIKAWALHDHAYLPILSRPFLETIV